MLDEVLLMFLHQITSPLQQSPQITHLKVYAQEIIYCIGGMDRSLAEYCNSNGYMAIVAKVKMRCIFGFHDLLLRATMVQC